jgi:amino acid adenylation domain-containing protein/non-ribosomal peptide synthase protein (TIGR01720 family)
MSAVTTSVSPRYEQITLKLKAIINRLTGFDANEIDIHGSYLDAGVESLLLIQVGQAIQEEFGVKVSLMQLLDQLGTISSLAAYLEEHSVEVVPQQKINESIAAPVEPLLPYELPANGNEKAGEPMPPPALVERIMNHQLSLMSRQLELLNRSYAAGPSKETPAAQLSPAQSNGASRQPAASLNVDNTAYVAHQPLEKGTTGGLNPVQQNHIKNLIARHTRRTRESKRWTEKYRPVFADGRNSVGFRQIWKEMVYQVIGAKTVGSKIWDVDSNEYVDLAMGFGVHLFGHSPRFLTEALAARLDDGLGLGVQSDLAGRAAELLCEITNSERANFCNSGTEAVLAAIRVARTVTRRNRIALFAGAYHGWSDVTTVRGLGAGGVLQAAPASPGVSPNTVQDALVLEYDSPRSLEYLKDHCHELAAVLVEPVQSHRPDLQPKEFLQELRRITEEAETPLIFDEMVTGFRVHAGGVQALFGIQADLVTYGKVLGGGMPIGVVAGKSSLMDTFDGGLWNFGDASFPVAEKTLFGGTFFKHPLSMAAACAVLEYLKECGPGLQERLNETTTTLAQRLNTCFAELEAPIRVVHFSSLFRFVFDRSTAFTDLFFYHLLNNDIFTWEGRNCFLSIAHGAEDIEQIVNAVRKSVIEMQAGEFFPASSTAQSNGHKPETVSSGDIFAVPLTEAQKILWVTAQKDDDASAAYNESTTLRLKGSLNLDALKHAIRQVVERHEALRTTFSPDGDVQLIHPRMDLEIPLIDCSRSKPAERETQIKWLLETQTQEAFDLVNGPLLRACVVRVAKEEHLFILTIHHLVIDGLSFSVLLGELSAIYSAKCQQLKCELPAPMGFSKFVEWQAEMRAQRTTESESYWLERFTGEVPVLELPLDRPRPLIQTFNGARERRLLSADVYRRLRSFSAEQRSTGLMACLAASHILLHKLTGQKDIVVGIAAAGQAAMANEHLVGYFVNLLPMRCKVDPKLTFRELLAAVRKEVLGAYEHQDYPFAKLLEKLELRTEPSRAPLVNVVLNIDVAGGGLRLHGLEVDVEESGAGAAKFDLYLDITETDGDTILEFEYNRDLFDSTTIQRWLDHYAILLEEIVKNPEREIRELSMLTAAERQRLVVELNDTKSPFPREHCIHELFEAQAAQTPQQIALVSEQESLTYEELNVRANQLAHYLRRLGVGPETLVGLMLERSTEMVVALLGVLKAGGAYVPLDPHYPAERLRHMLRDAGMAVLVSERRWLEELGAAELPQVITFADEAEQIGKESKSNLPHETAAQNLAYVIYTSGSTGLAKGIAVEHRAVIRLLFGTNYIDLQPSDRIAQLSSPSFDAATFEIWGALLHGAQLVVFSKDLCLSPREFAERIESAGITTIFLTTALFNQFARIASNAFASLHTVLFGGEAVDPGCVREVLKNGPPRRLLNAYGPTESTTFASWHLIQHVADEATNVPIGSPLSNTELYVLDSDLEPVVIGARGELYIGGDGLARSYLHQPDLTAARFIPNPFAAGERLYRTGDVVRRLPGGEIEFQGRIDNLVKIRGFRIELSEIEIALNSHPGVGSCVVMARENIAGDSAKRLVAYVSPDETFESIEELNAKSLRTYLKQRLPDYMLPSSFVFLEKLPLNRNGKVDHEALPLPGAATDSSSEHSGPQTAIEQTLHDVWSRVLGVRTIGRDDNFFDLGGDSILGIQIAARGQQAGLNLKPTHVFQHPTIAELATVMSVEPAPTTAEQGMVVGAVPLTPIQSWFFEHHASDLPHHFNQSVMIEVPATLDAQMLDQTVRQLLVHHDALRMRFEQTEFGWQQANHDREEIPVLSEIHISDLREAQLAEILTQLQTTLDLAHGPLLSVNRLNLGNDRPNRLLIAIHHLVVDGVSWRILLEDLERGYELAKQGRPLELGPKTTSFKEWSERLSEYAQTPSVHSQLNYWQRQAAEPTAALPLDHSGGANTVESEDTVTLLLDREETTSLLRDAAPLYQTGVQDLLTAVLARSLWRWTSARRLMIDMEGHGREQLFPEVDLSRTVGWFTTIYPVVLELEPAAHDLPSLIDHVKETVGSVPLKGIGYGLLRYLSNDAEIRETMRQLPAAEIAFNYLGQFGETTSDEGLFRLTSEPTGETRSSSGKRSYLLEVVAIVTSGTLQISISYSRNVHSKETIETLAGWMKEDLKWLVAHCRPPSEFDWTQSELDEINAVLNQS